MSFLAFEEIFFANLGRVRSLRVFWAKSEAVSATKTAWLFLAAMPSMPKAVVTTGTEEAMASRTLYLVPRPFLMGARSTLAREKAWRMSLRSPVTLTSFWSFSARIWVVGLRPTIQSLVRGSFCLILGQILRVRNRAASLLGSHLKLPTKRTVSRPHFIEGVLAK